MNTMCVSEWSGWITKSFDEIKICFCTLILIKAVHTQRLRPFEINEGIISYHISIILVLFLKVPNFAVVIKTNIIIVIKPIRDKKQ